jgi:hypothetical protein
MYDKKMPSKKAMPMTIMVAVSKPKPLPKRGQRTATNMANKAKKK